jgi:hypothetical protein
MLDLNFDRFEWARPADKAKGFCWEGQGENRHLAKVPRAVFQPYVPGSALYRTFASLDGSEREILRFANSYGRLGRAGGTMDFLDTWRGLIRKMRRLMVLADVLVGGGGGGGGQAIRAALGEITPADLEAARDNRRTPVARIDLDDLTPGDLTPGDCAHAALARVLRDVLGGGGVLSDLSLRSTWDSRTGELHATFARDNLWGLLLSQLGLAVIEKRRFRQCATCPTWFELSPRRDHGRRGRDDKVTCSHDCRTKLSRQRRRAVEMAREGKAVRAIAREVGLSVEAVRQWVSGKKGG